jgi:hypothetical protein
MVWHHDKGWFPQQIAEALFITDQDVRYHIDEYIPNQLADLLYSKRWTWEKFTFAYFPYSKGIVFEVRSKNDDADCEVYPEFLKV